MARIKLNPPSHAATEIAELAAMGFSKKGIAQHFCVCANTLERWFEEDVNLLAAFEVGRERERQALHNTLYKLAMEGDKVAAIFLLKARHGYKDTGETENQGNRVAITFNLPGAMKVEEYKVIDGDAGTPIKQLPS